VPDVVITDGALEARDETKHVALKIGSFDAELRPGTSWRCACAASAASSRWAQTVKGPALRPTRSTCRRRSPG
jgi:hypothetical protein